MQSQPQTERTTKVLGFTPNVFFLGVVSFLTDLSSDMIQNMLPLYLANVLGAKTSIIGLVEGVGDSSSSLLRIVSGWMSDRMGKRKGLTALGYFLSAASRPFLLLASVWAAVLAIKFTDRVGKGIRAAPRDALLADSAEKRQMGKSFGFHRAMDTLGAVVGVGLAAAIVYGLQGSTPKLEWNTFKVIVITGMVPGFLAVLVLVAFVRERSKGAVAMEKARGGKVHLGQLGGRYWAFLIVMLTFSLGNISTAFLVLRAQNLGIALYQIFLLLLAFNLFYTVSSLPAGMVSDKIGRKAVIGAGWLVYGLTCVGLAVASSWWHVLGLFLAYGLYQGMTDGVTGAMVGDLIPQERRGEAYGFYHTMLGIAILPASVVAGVLWQVFGPAAAFWYGAALGFTACAGLLVLVHGKTGAVAIAGES